MLFKTNNFPEFTGRVCPAPCEEACVLSINDKPVTIKLIEQNIIDHAFDKGWVKPKPPELRTGKKVAVIGSGPAGLAAAAQLNKAGHWSPSSSGPTASAGCSPTASPTSSSKSTSSTAAIKLMAAEGIKFVTNANVGVQRAGGGPPPRLRRDRAVRRRDPARDLKVPGRELKGIYRAMDYLPLAEQGVPRRRRRRRAVHRRQGQARHHPRRRRHRGRLPRHRAAPGRQEHQAVRTAPPPARGPQRGRVKAGNLQPWPYWPMIFRTSSAHEEASRAVRRRRSATSPSTPRSSAARTAK